MAAVIFWIPVFPQDVLPPADTWENYPLLGVYLLTFVIIGLGLRYAWKEITKWQAEQNAQREAERERQRLWQAAQNEQREKAENKRAELYMGLIERMESRQATQTESTNAILAKLVERMDVLTVRMAEHDTFARTAVEEPTTRSRKKGPPIV